MSGMTTFSTAAPALLDDTLQSRLDRALARSAAAVHEHDAQSFAAVAGSLAQVVLVGCGQVGRSALKGLRAMQDLQTLDVESVAFADNNPAVQGSEIDGVPVLTPAGAVAQFGVDAVYVATLFNPRPVLRQLEELGCTRVLPYTALFRAFPETYLPYYAFGLPEGAIGSAAEIRNVLGLLTDETSKQTLVELVEWWIDGDSAALSDPKPRGETYLAPDLFALTDSETYVDCGAFDGDSIVAFLDKVAGKCHEVIAVEPDPKNAAAIPASIARDLPGIDAPTVRIHPVAAGSTSSTLRFDARNTAGSVVTDSGNMDVPVRPLDQLLADARPTYLKADVEGHELELLDGAEGLIARGETIWALTCYHVQDHAWTIPARFLPYTDRYTFHLRRYADDCWETVFYAVPRGRALVPAQRGAQ
jgi:FkbM family methyltransferase